VVMNRWRMSLLLVAITRLVRGRPMLLANQPARISPKLPIEDHGVSVTLSGRKMGKQAMSPE